MEGVQKESHRPTTLHEKAGTVARHIADSKTNAELGYLAGEALRVDITHDGSNLRLWLPCASTGDGLEGQNEEKLVILLEDGQRGLDQERWRDEPYPSALSRFYQAVLTLESRAAMHHANEEAIHMLLASFGYDSDWLVSVAKIDAPRPITAYYRVRRRVPKLAVLAYPLFVVDGRVPPSAWSV